MITAETQEMIKVKPRKKKLLKNKKKVVHNLKQLETLMKKSVEKDENI